MCGVVGAPSAPPLPPQRCPDCASVYQGTARRRCCSSRASCPRGGPPRRAARAAPRALAPRLTRGALPHAQPQPRAHRRRGRGSAGADEPAWLPHAAPGRCPGLLLITTRAPLPQPMLRRLHPAPAPSAAAAAGGGGGDQLAQLEAALEQGPLLVRALAAGQPPLHAGGSRRRPRPSPPHAPPPPRLPCPTPQPRPKLRVRPLRRRVQWYKWEGRWFERWQQRQQELLQAGDAAPQVRRALPPLPALLHPERTSAATQRRAAPSPPPQAALPASSAEDPYLRRFASPAAHQAYLDDPVAMGAFECAAPAPAPD